MKGKVEMSNTGPQRSPLFEKALQNARDEAYGLKHDVVAAVHLLLGMLMVDDTANVGGNLLEGAGIRYANAKEVVEVLCPPGDHDGHISNSIEFDVVVGIAEQDAHELGHQFVHTGHLLVALCRCVNTDAAEALTRLDYNLEGAEKSVSDLHAAP